MSDVFATSPECAYEGTAFPVERAEWDGGNDLVEHTAYRRPGADIEPTGRKPYRGALVIPLVNTTRLVARYGELFPGLRYDLLTLFEATPIGTLMHPTLGQLTVAIGEISETAEAGDRGGVRLTVRWVEHNASVSLLASPTESAEAREPERNVEQLATAADTAVAAVAADYEPMGVVVVDRLAYIELAPRSFSEIGEAVRRMLRPVEANLRLAALALASSHAATLACLRLRAAVYALRARLIPLAQQRVYVVPRDMALWEVSQAVYGRSDLVTLLRSANGISDPARVRAGRRIVVLPVPRA